MQGRLGGSFFAAIALVGLALAGIAARAGASDQDPGRIVATSSQAVVHELSERRAEFQSDPAALHRFVRGEFAQTFDREYAARLVLGGSDIAASDSDVRTFADALADYLLDRYGSALLKIDPGLLVNVVSQTSLRDGTIVKVTSLVDRRHGAPISVDYLFHQRAGHWLAFDVVVEGVSFVQTFRAVFAEALRSKSLRDVTADLRSGRIQLGVHPAGQLPQKQ